MKPQRILQGAALALAVAATFPAVSHARQIERACASSGRVAAGVHLCSCIQSVADQMLSGREQRLAASFFADPHRAQEVRTSSRQQDASFWLRYKRFGTLAAQRCR